MFKLGKLKGLLTIGLASVLLIACGESGDDKIVIRVGHDSGVQHPVQDALLEFEKSLEEKSDGKFDVQVFPASQLGNATELLEQVRRGDATMGLGASTHFTQTTPELAIWESFFLFDDAEHARRVLDGKAGQETLKPLESMGITGLGYMEMGFRNFSNSKRPVEKVEDLKGLKIRGYNPIQIKAWEPLGVSLTNLSWSELFTSLQQNLIDGQESATTSFYTEKFYEAQEYYTLTKHIYTNYPWYINTEFLGKLSDEDRSLLESEVAAAIDKERELMAKNEEEMLEELPGLGVEVNELSMGERQKMGKIMNEAISKDIIDQTGKDLYDMVMEEVEANR
ncbi:TRAP transporter substrate-binding protein [Sporosarcina ureae]|uniref:TRAP transporter substrate-binding protein n=1 Tax=Sporosarcina ureae TaxID=1571 RepID=UPI0026EF8138|nr:TRAP transporter substrate-binding protein [Sporosarcina ureae]